MPHADSSSVPEALLSKTEFWQYLHLQLVSLLDEQTSWVTNLSNTASIVYYALMEFQAFGARDGLPVVNWCGFYLDSCLFPPNSSHPSALQDDTSRILLLGPFCGKPACQYIKAKKGGGVCSDSYLARKSLVVPDVEAYPGHIACDGNTRSEIVLPMKLQRRNPDTAEDEEIVLGVMDLDSTVLSAFDDEDTKGLERIVQTVVLSCTW